MSDKKAEHVEFTVPEDGGREEAPRRLSVTGRRISVVDDVFGEIVEGGPNYRSVGWIGTAVLMMKTQIGLGVLAIPSVFDVLGMIPGIICLLAIGGITTWSDYYIGVFKLLHRSVYGIDDAGALMFGRAGREILATAYVLYLVFVTGAAMLSISISLNALSTHGACTAVFVAVSAAIAFGFSSIQTLGKISWIAWVGLAGIMTAIFTVTIAVGLQERPAAAPPGGIFKSDYKLFNKPKFTDAVTSISSLVFAYSGTPSFFAIVSEMADPHEYTRAVLTCQSIVTVVYLIIGIVVYYFAGSYVASPALGSAGVLLKKAHSTGQGLGPDVEVAEPTGYRREIFRLWMANNSPSSKGICGLATTIIPCTAKLPYTPAPVTPSTPTPPHNVSTLVLIYLILSYRHCLESEYFMTSATLEMATAQEEDMYLFNAGLDQTPNAFAAADFDPFLESSADQDNEAAADSFFNLPDLVKQEQQVNSPADLALKFPQLHRGSGSSSSSAASGNLHNRNHSEVSVTSSALAGQEKTWGSGINGLTMPATQQFFDDSTMTGIDQDFEASNKQMASDFDFDTAASTPSGFDATIATMAAKPTAMQPFPSTAKISRFSQASGPSPKMAPAAQPAFFFAGSREASPLSAMLPAAQGHSPWNKHSPSAGLEETFNHITMNGDSPGNTTLSPNSLQFPPAQPFSFEPESSATPSSFKDISSPPSTVHSTDGVPHLTVHPTSLKSRVETQIPIKLTLSCLPPGVKKLHLPIHTVSKPKFLVKGGVEKSPDMLELHTSLVCTSAMQDPVKLQRALARARGEDPNSFSKPSPASATTSSSSKDDDDRPLNGGEVRICVGCIQRERKRASRKKQKKPDEEEAFQKDEEKRVVVFNTNEVKEWTDSSKDASSTHSTPLALANGSGAVHVELPMRIACYCRHQNEKMGFQVIFTIKDFRDKLVAQAMTNPIMITDDHKTHNSIPSAPQAPVSLPTAPQFPGAGVFATAADNSAALQGGAAKMFKHSFSTNDLHALQNNFAPNLAMPASHKPFAVPSTFSMETSATMTPRNLSRPASPSGPTGPTSKKRKQSNSGKLPSGLTMTRLDASHEPASSAVIPPNTASTASTYPPPITASRLNPMGTSPPTPNGIEQYATNINRSFSLENLPRQAVISAPSSRQASRPGSPGSGRASFGATDVPFSQAVSNQLLGNNTSRRPSPLIHKLVPAEGSVTGGTEVTLLGNGFYQGLEVMFGDTEATTTTFWGEKCLNCIAPPSLQHGTVPVVFKHEHPQYATVQPSQTRSTIFTYIDDRELEILRLALRTIGKQMQHPTDDPFSAAQQLLQGQQQSMWGAPATYSMMGAHQRAAGLDGAPMDTLELENVLVFLLEFIDTKTPSALQRLDLRRPSGLTLLHLASSLGLTRFVAGLLVRGANPNLADKNGNTPLHHAAMNGHTHIIHRLRLAGGNHQARCLRGFVPADLATSLLAYQAVFTPPSHYRSRSVGGTPIRLHSRRESTSSLRSFWEKASTSYFDSDSEESNSGETEALELTEHPRSRSNTAAITISPSRRGSFQQTGQILPVLKGPTMIDSDPNAAPPAFMLAWRDHLVAQLQQFNESAQSVMPSLATLNGPLQALQEYQAYPMVRRVSSFFPQMPSSRPNTGGQKEGWWETLTGSSSPAATTPATETSAPPAYDDLYPENETSNQDWSMKKQSAVQAVVDIVADQHFEAQPSDTSRPSSAVENDGELKGSPLTRRTTQRVELSQDRKLFFFWIPILLVLLFLMARSSGITDLLRPQQGGAKLVLGNAVEVA
ncbi:hypothetical protein DV738_g4192, partial [Chaetothyriales sp. CBS 135597]